jgi:TolB-like protein
MANMSIHEFVTIAVVYLDNLRAGLRNTPLAAAFCRKIIDSIQEFNELQLFLFKTTIEKTFGEERNRFEGDDASAAKLMF